MNNSSVNRTFWLAGELAKAAGVSTDTLRHYERKGVLPRPGRGINGYRQYPESALNRVLLVRRALAVGFTLDELTRILSECDKGGTPCRKVRGLVEEKLTDVEKHLTALLTLRDELRSIISEWDSRLTKAAPDAKVKLLETLKPSSDSKTYSLLATKKR